MVADSRYFSTVLILIFHEISRDYRFSHLYLRRRKYTSLEKGITLSGDLSHTVSVSLH